MLNLLFVSRTQLKNRGDRAFEFVAPKQRNALPPPLQSAVFVDLKKKIRYRHTCLDRHFVDWYAPGIVSHYVLCFWCYTPVKHYVAYNCEKCFINIFYLLTEINIT